MTIATRLAFGLPADPWAALDVRTADTLRVAALLRAAVSARAWVSVLGPRGAGKTRAVGSALGASDTQVVAPLRLDRERLHLGDVTAALVRELSSESLRRSGEARAAQVRRILGQRYGAGAPVALLIDDAHLLHRATVIGLKRLRELSWRGRSPLLAVVLVGQADRAAALPEAGLRQSSHWLAGLSSREVALALRQALGSKIADEAVDIPPPVTNWLDLQRLIDEAIAAALARGADVVGAADIGAALHPADATAPPPAPVSAEAVDRVLAA